MRLVVEDSKNWFAFPIGKKDEHKTEGPTSCSTTSIVSTVPVVPSPLPTNLLSHLEQTTESVK